MHVVPKFWKQRRRPPAWSEAGVLPGGATLQKRDGLAKAV